MKKYFLILFSSLFFISSCGFADNLITNQTDDSIIVSGGPVTVIGPQILIVGAHQTENWVWGADMTVCYGSSSSEEASSGPCFHVTNAQQGDALIATGQCKLKCQQSRIGEVCDCTIDQPTLLVQIEQLDRLSSDL